MQCKCGAFVSSDQRNCSNCGREVNPEGKQNLISDLPLPNGRNRRFDKPSHSWAGVPAKDRVKPERYGRRPSYLNQPPASPSKPTTPDKETDAAPDTDDN